MRISNSLLETLLYLTLIIVEFAVAELKSSEWDSMPLERLELKPEKKMIIQALAESVGPGQDGVFDDFVRGKGQGIISLLQHGRLSILCN